MSRQRNKIRTRRQTQLLNEFILPLSIFFAILASSAIITYLIADPLIYPNRHPRIQRFTKELAHHHPRLYRIACVLPICVVPLALIMRLAAPIYGKHRWRKKTLLSPPVMKHQNYLNHPIKESFSVLLPQAWQKAKDVLPGLFIQIPDVRRTHWELLEQNENRQELRLQLRYVHDPLAIKPWRLYPRKLSCTLKLTGKGMRSEAALCFYADSTMDYKTVYTIIDHTRASVKAAMAA